MTNNFKLKTKKKLKTLGRRKAVYRQMIWLHLLPVFKYKAKTPLRWVLILGQRHYLLLTTYTHPGVCCAWHQN